MIVYRIEAGGNAGMFLAGEVAANSPVFIILRDNGRDPELTEVPRNAQKKYFARKGRQQQR